MKFITKLVMFPIILLFVSNCWFFSALANHDDHKKKRRNIRHNDKPISIAKNVKYIQECGECHVAYPSLLLPSESWDKILENLENHFGEEIELGPDSKNEILAYLTANAAEQSPAEISRKIMKSLGEERPNRITEVPYIVKEHHEVSKEMLGRSSIGSLSNCSACHTTADKGNFDDDDVVIPK